MNKKRGRPPLDRDDPVTASMSIRWPLSEFEAICRDAAALELCPSELVRQVYRIFWNMCQQGWDVTYVPNINVDHDDADEIQEFVDALTAQLRNLNWDSEIQNCQHGPPVLPFRTGGKNHDPC